MHVVGKNIGAGERGAGKKQQKKRQSGIGSRQCKTKTKSSRPL
jgi:hypothetical protein